MRINIKLYKMIVQLKWVILFLLILRLAAPVVYSQDHSTRNNYKGAWETPASWNPAWPVPQTDVNNLDITINGYITAHSSLTFSGASSKLIVDDTLVIIGNLIIDDDNDVQVNNDGILIVRGNLTISTHTKIEAKNYIIITGKIIKLGPTNDGEFTSDDNPVKVFVGGTISPASLTDNKPKYPALDCTSPNTDPYPHSGCSHGDMTDIITDPIYPFFQSTCATATLASSDANNSFCAGTSVTFTAGGGTNYDFRVNGISVQNGGSTTYTTTVLTHGAIVDVVVTGDGCTVPSTGITNTVIALPVATANSNSPVCAGSPLTLAGGPAGMTTYSWTGPDGFTANTRNPTVSSAATAAMASIYSLTVTNASGCTSVPATTTVVVNSLPLATATSNSPVCTGGPLTLAGGPAGMTTYSWTGPDGFNTNTQNPTVSPAATEAMAGIYSLTVTNASGCTSAAVITTVLVNSPIASAASNSPVCTGSPLTLAGGPSGMASYSWTGSNGFTSLSQNPSVSTEATLVMGGIYTLTVTNANGCSDTTTLSVLINENPNAIAGPEQKLEFVFETQMNAELSSSETGEWSLVSGKGRIGDIHSPTTLVTELSPGENIFLWKVQNSNCESSAKVKITVQDLFIPSVITPNGDGINDYFKINENIGKVYLIVFNRWGNQEYTNDEYKNEWDGRNNKGAELPVDTYFYIMKFENGRIEKGSVLIQR
jgi:gliding motility-associated-like protein